MAEEIGFENGRNSNFQGLVTLTLTLDPAIRYTVVHHSSTSTYTKFHSNRRNFLWTDGRTDVRTYGHFSPSNIIRSTFGSRPKKSQRCARDVVAMTKADDPPDRDKPENCGVLLHHSNNKTNVLPTLHVHNLLTGTLLFVVNVLLTKNVVKIKDVKNAFLFLKKTFLHLY